jgi:hypothetical protein
MPSTLRRPDRQHLAGHHRPLRTWIFCLDFMGLIRERLKIAQELDINKDNGDEFCEIKVNMMKGFWSLLR